MDSFGFGLAGLKYGVFDREAEFFVFWFAFEAEVGRYFIFGIVRIIIINIYLFLIRWVLYI